MDLEEIGIIAGNWVDSAQDRDYWRAPCECGIEPAGFISHGVSYIQTRNLCGITAMMDVIFKIFCYS